MGSKRMLDLYAELNELREYCKRNLELDLKREQELNNEFKNSKNTYSRREAERLGKIKQEEVVEQEKKLNEKSELIKLQDSMNELFSDVLTKITNQTDIRQCRVFKRKRESQEQEDTF